MTNPQLVALELNGDDEKTFRTLLQGGDQSKLQDFLMGRVDKAIPVSDEVLDKLEADAVKEVEDVEKIGKGLQELVVRSFKAELRERLMRDILDCTHWLLHSADGEEVPVAQEICGRAMKLLCVSSNIFDGKIDYATATFIAQEVREIKAMKEKSTCVGSA